MRIFAGSAAYKHGEQFKIELPKRPWAGALRNKKIHHISNVNRSIIKDFVRCVLCTQGRWLTFEKTLQIFQLSTYQIWRQAWRAWWQRRRGATWRRCTWRLDLVAPLLHCTRAWWRMCDQRVWRRSAVFQNRLRRQTLATRIWNPKFAFQEKWVLPRLGFD